MKKASMLSIVKHEDTNHLGPDGIVASREAGCTSLGGPTSKRCKRQLPVHPPSIEAL